MTEKVGHLGLQRRLDDPARKLRKQPPGPGELLGLQPLDGVLQRPLGQQAGQAICDLLRRPWPSGSTPGAGRRLDFIVLATLEFAPDGCAIDNEGRIWSADIAGRRCLILLEEGGRIVDSLQAPDGLNFFACQIGGDDSNTLLICASPDFEDCSRRRHQDAQLLTTEIT